MGDWQLRQVRSTFMIYGRRIRTATTQRKTCVLKSTLFYYSYTLQHWFYYRPIPEGFKSVAGRFKRKSFLSYKDCISRGQQNSFPHWWIPWDHNFTDRQLQYIWRDICAVCEQREKKPSSGSVASTSGRKHAQINPRFFSHILVLSYFFLAKFDSVAVIEGCHSWLWITFIHQHSFKSMIQSLSCATSWAQSLW